MISDTRRYRLRRLLQESRHRLICLHGDLARQLREVYFVARKDIRRISTNGPCIYFDPDWLIRLSPTSLDFALAHQLMHILLGHTDRPSYYRGDRFHLACDIVANAVLRELGWQHDRLPMIGRIYCDTFFPITSGYDLSAYEALSGVPFDPALLPESKRRSYLIDSDQAWEDHDPCGRLGTLVLSPHDPDPPDLIDDGIDLGQTHLRIVKRYHKRHLDAPLEEPSPGKEEKERSSRVKNRIAHIRDRTQPDRYPNQPPALNERQWLYRPVRGLDWHDLTRLFISDDLHDYSFTPPDRRMSESEFFMPDYAVERESVKDLLIMVDTSGSVDAPMLDRVCTHVRQLLAALNDTVDGYIGFFDTRVYGPYPLEGLTDPARLRPVGNGGTDVCCVFEHAKQYDRLSGLILFTDGEFDFPDPPRSLDLPVLWLFTKPCKAPWGHSAVIE